MNPPLITVKNLSITYPNGVKAIDDISFSLNENESMAVVGESGSGKSTLAMHLMLLLNPNWVKQGHVYFGEKEISSFTKQEKNAYQKKEASIVLQDPLSALNPSLSLFFQINELLDPKINKQGRLEKALHLLESVGIEDPLSILHYYPHQLSGGQRQRALLAIALAKEPKLLIADEPTTALDPIHKKQLLDLLKKLQKTFSLSILFITHELSLISYFTTQTIVLLEGKIVEKGETKSILKNPSHPYTKKLITSQIGYKKEREKQLVHYIQEKSHEKV